ncbi:MAG: hypothetical protein ACK5PF_05280, partial [bacterium]
MRSEPRTWHAGVRQGCCLSPLLYLFAAWALSCHIQATPDLAPPDLPAGAHCGQYADDMQVPLASLDVPHVRRLQAALRTFAAATGQHARADKCKLLPMGPRRLEAAEIDGIPVVSTLTVLGVELRAGMPGPPQEATWQPVVTRIHQKTTQVARFGCSAFGRAAATSGYCLSKALHRGEFDGVPKDSFTALQKAANALTDCGRPPILKRRPASSYPKVGLPSALLCDNPRRDGLGLLPLRQHLYARQARWGLRLARHLAAPAAAAPAAAPAAAVPVAAAAAAAAAAALPQPASPPLWMELARMLLARSFPTVPPAVAFLTCILHGQTTQTDFPVLMPDYAARPLPDPLMRLSNATSKLGTLSTTRPTADSATLLTAPHTCTDLSPQLSAALSSLQWSAPAAPAACSAPGVSISLLQGDLPEVRQLTRAQLQHTVDVQRSFKHTLFVGRARAAAAWFPRAAAPAEAPRGLPPLATAKEQLISSLGYIWGLPMCNSAKEVYWRLSMMGVSGAGGHGICPKGPCVCGAPAPSDADRQNPQVGGPALHAHYFWDCPVAQAVLTEVCAALHPHVTHLHRSHLWLCIP